MSSGINEFATTPAFPDNSYYGVAPPKLEATSTA